MSWYSAENAKPLHISQDVLRSVLYGKWCNVFGNDRELTFKADAVFRNKDIYQSENSKLLFNSCLTLRKSTFCIILVDFMKRNLCSEICNRSKYKLVAISIRCVQSLFTENTNKYNSLPDKDAIIIYPRSI